MTFQDEHPGSESVQQAVSSDGEPKGRLKIFFGYCAGVGKTYAMLAAADQLHQEGCDVVVGYVEPHTRPDTLALIKDIPSLAPKVVDHKGIHFSDFNLDAALARKPQVILVDGLAHSNPEGFRNRKRYQDVEELLNAGIDVYTTVSVQNIESMTDAVGKITGVEVKERIPDSVFDQADKIRLIDMDPEELLRRFEAGQIDTSEKGERRFFTAENLNALRELTLRQAADKIVNKIRGKKKKTPFSKMLVCVSASLASAHCIRTTARIADAFRIPWVALYVKITDVFDPDDRRILQDNMDLAEQLGAEIVTLKGDDLLLVVSEYIRQAGVTNVVVGKSRGRHLPFKEEFEDRLLGENPDIEVHIVPDIEDTGAKKKRGRKHGEEWLRRHLSTANFSAKDLLKTLLLIVLATLLSLGVRELHLGDQNVIMVYILSVLVISRVTSGYLYGIVASIVGVMLFNFFFTEPYYTFNVTNSTYPVTFAIMLMVALITSALTNGVKVQAKMAVMSERRMEILYELSKKLLVLRTREEIVDFTNESLVDIFGRSVIFHTQRPNKDSRGSFRQARGEESARYLFSSDEEAVAHWVFQNKKSAGNGTDTLSGAKGFYTPVIFQDRVLGVIGMSCVDEKLLPKRRAFLKVLISQVAIALERQRLFDEQGKTHS